MYAKMNVTPKSIPPHEIVLHRVLGCWVNNRRFVGRVCVLVCPGALVEKNSFGDTVLVTAVREAAVEVVQRLVAPNLSSLIPTFLDIKNNSTNTALTFSCFTVTGHYEAASDREANLAIFKLLVDVGADVNHVPEHGDGVVAKLMHSPMTSVKYSERALRHLLEESPRARTFGHVHMNARIIQVAIGFDQANLELQRLVLAYAAKLEDQAPGSGDPTNLLRLRLGSVPMMPGVSDQAPTTLPVVVGCIVTKIGDGLRHRVVAAEPGEADYPAITVTDADEANGGISAADRERDWDRPSRWVVQRSNCARVPGPDGVAEPGDPNNVGWLRPGSRVLLQRLTGKPALNGKPALVSQYLMQKDRWVVRLLETGETMSVKGNNCDRDPDGLETGVQVLRHRHGAVIANPEGLVPPCPTPTTAQRDEAEERFGSLSACAKAHIDVVLGLTDEQLDTLYFPACMVRWGGANGKHGPSDDDGVVGVPLRELLRCWEDCRRCGGDGSQYFCFCMNRSVNDNKVENCSHCQTCWYAKYGVRRCAHCRWRDPGYALYDSTEGEDMNEPPFLDEPENPRYSEYQERLAAEGYWGW